MLRDAEQEAAAAEARVRALEEARAALSSGLEAASGSCGELQGQQEELRRRAAAAAAEKWVAEGWQRLMTGPGALACGRPAVRVRMQLRAHEVNSSQPSHATPIHGAPQARGAARDRGAAACREAVRGSWVGPRPAGRRRGAPPGRRSSGCRGAAAAAGGRAQRGGGRGAADRGRGGARPGSRRRGGGGGSGSGSSKRRRPALGVGGVRQCPSVEQRGITFLLGVSSSFATRCPAGIGLLWQQVLVCAHGAADHFATGPWVLAPTW